MQPTVYGEIMIRHVRLALETLSQGQNAMAAMRAGLAGHVDVGVIITASMTLVPRAIINTKAEAPNLSIGVDVGTSDVLMDRFKRGQLDFLIARVQQQGDESCLLYEDLSPETECAVARIGHPLLQRQDIALSELASAGWILSPRGSILRHQFDMVFRRNGLNAPRNVVETTAMSVIKSLLHQTDFLHVMPTEIARYYVESGELAILPVDLPCSMDNFGIITHPDRQLSPGAKLLLNHIRLVAGDIYCGFKTKPARSCSPNS
jgi:DNA-binding transcriptional LysR family regulator